MRDLSASLSLSSWLSYSQSSEFTMMLDELLGYSFLGHFNANPKFWSSRSRCRDAKAEGFFILLLCISVPTYRQQQQSSSAVRSMPLCVCLCASSSKVM